MKLDTMRGSVYIQSRGKRSIWEEVAKLLGLCSPRREDCGVTCYVFFFSVLSSLTKITPAQIFVALQTLCCQSTDIFKIVCDPH